MSDLVSLTELPPRSRFVLRARPAAILACGAAFGVALPPLGSAVEAGSRAILGLGPDEWLLLAGTSEAASIVAAFEGTLAGQAFSLVEVSDRNLAFAIEGPKAARLLNCGCPLDFSAFPIGMCSRTVLSKAEILLWRTGEARYHLEVWRSFAPYVVGLLREAGREFGL